MGYVTSLSFRADNPSVGYIGGYYYDTTGYSRGKVFKTTNAGLSWTELGASLFDPKKYSVNGVVSDPANANRILVATAYYGVYVSTDGGASFTTPSQTTLRTTCLIEDPTVTGRFWLGTDNAGVWTSTNSGVNWQQMNPGLIALNILCLVYDPVNRALYAGTKGGGLYRYDISTGIDEHMAGPFPERLVLDQNYPNPFNGSSVIGYRIAHTGVAKMSIYDLLGREVAVLVNEEKTPGFYSVKFDAGGLSSGMYLYRLSSGSNLEVKAMVLVK